MKLVINRCFGGFSLSPRAVQRLAELQGKPCYFFRRAGGICSPTTLEEIGNSLFWCTFSVPVPPYTPSGTVWVSLTQEQKDEANRRYEEVHLEQRPKMRADPLLVQVVEELGDDASGECAELKVIEIPDGVSYEIKEYDGLEHVAEIHRTWN